MSIILLFDNNIKISDAFDSFVGKLAAIQGIKLVSPDTLTEAFDNQETVLFINPYGKMFPVESWNGFLRFLERGGSWLNIGGKALRQNLKNDNKETDERNALHRELGIYHYPKVNSERLNSYSHNKKYPFLEKYKSHLPQADIHELYYTLVNEHDRGKLDVFTNPTGETETLIMSRGEGNRPLGAAVFLWNHLWGRFNGSRWIFMNWEPDDRFWQSSHFLNLCTELIDLAEKGAETFKLRPVFASYYPHEQASLKLYTKSWRPAKKVKITGQLTKEEQTLFEFNADTVLGMVSSEIYIPLPVKLEPGFYTCLAKLESGNTQIHLATGFWIYDASVLNRPVKLSVEKDYILKDGKPLPIVGTSYMGSDAHRWSFTDPNPAVWMQDVAEMKKAGINMIRSGLWNGENWLQPTYGLGGEVALRAFDAFVQTMTFFEMPLILTLMAFSPGKGAGKSPWYEPASILWQKELIGQFVRRFKNVGWIIWDLINEPSMSDPERLWTVRPKGDPYEKLFWQKWLKEKHENIVNLRSAWDMTPAELPDFDQAALPTDCDFADQNWTLDNIKHQRAIDYVHFIQDYFRDWLSDHVRIIHEMGSTQLITMGQTEPGVTTAPNPVMHADVIDFTAIHSWSLNDDVLWKILQSKTPGVPHLFGETGSFPQDDPNKEIRRSEEDLFKLYERKYIYAFAARSAGTIHWIWNTAPTNSGEKESAVGGRRGSGSEKDELSSLRLLAFLVENCRQCFEHAADDPVYIVTPLDNIFAPRSMAGPATQNALRTLFFDLKQPAGSVTPFNIDKVYPRLFVLPSARTLSDEGWAKLMEKVRQGAVLLISGPVDYDEYFKHKNRLVQLGIHVSQNVQPVARDEYFSINTEKINVRYTHAIQDIADKAVYSDDINNKVKTIPFGRGKVIFCPLPLELADDAGGLKAFYNYGLQQAGFKMPDFEINNPGVLIRPLESENYIVYSAISECDQQTNLSWIDPSTESKIELRLNPKRAVLFILEKATGELVAAYLNGFLKVGDHSLYSEKGTIAITNLNTAPVLMAGDRAGHIYLSDNILVDANEAVTIDSDSKEIKITISDNYYFKAIKFTRPDSGQTHLKRTLTSAQE